MFPTGGTCFIEIYLKVLEQLNFVHCFAIGVYSLFSLFPSLPCVQVTRSRRKADVCVGCHSPREGEEEEVVCVTEHWILGE